jgi:hypothetical protein
VCLCRVRLVMFGWWEDMSTDEADRGERDTHHYADGQVGGRAGVVHGPLSIEGVP